MSIRFKSHSNSGDTIIEVMFAMAIIGIVLAAAYATASKNLQTSQLSKERTEATSIAASQLEQLKALENPPTTTDPFCLDITQAISVIAAPAAGCNQSYYSKSITRVGSQYRIFIEWTPPGGSDANKANVTIYYSDYDFSTAGSSHVNIFNVSSGVLGTAIVGVSVVNESSILESGLVYSTSVTAPIITTPGAVIVPKGVSSRFDTTLTGLVANTSYYVRGYIRTPSGYSYSSVLQLNGTLPPTCPSGYTGTPPSCVAIPPLAITLGDATNIGYSTATVTADVTGNGGGTITSREVALNTRSDMSVNLPGGYKIVAGSLNTGVQTVTFTDLLPNKTYYYSANVGNSQGRSESTIIKQFTTLTVPSANYNTETSYNHSKYYKSLALVTWGVARTNSTNLGGHLVSITSAGENTAVSGMSTPLNWGTWIGLEDLDDNNVWNWVTGEPVSYTNWASGAICGNQPEKTPYPGFPATARQVVAEISMGTSPGYDSCTGKWNDEINLGGTYYTNKFIVEFTEKMDNY